jgi:hypothetical protein
MGIQPWQLRPYPRAYIPHPLPREEPIARPTTQSVVPTVESAFVVPVPESKPLDFKAEVS